MFYDTFVQLCNERGMSPTAVCVQAGLSNATATYWKKSQKTPKIESIEKVAEILNVPAEMLIGKKEAAHNTVRGEMTDIKGIMEVKQESEWRELLTRMSPENLDKLQEYAELLLLSQDRDDQAAK